MFKDKFKLKIKKTHRNDIKTKKIEMVQINSVNQFDFGAFFIIKTLHNRQTAIELIAWWFWCDTIDNLCV